MYDMAQLLLPPAPAKVRWNEIKFWGCYEWTPVRDIYDVPFLSHDHGQLILFQCRLAWTNGELVLPPQSTFISHLKAKAITLNQG